jgi:hypothetical protein
MRRSSHSCQILLGCATALVVSRREVDATLDQPLTRCHPCTPREFGTILGADSMRVYRSGKFGKKRSRPEPRPRLTDRADCGIMDAENRPTQSGLPGGPARPTRIEERWPSRTQRSSRSRTATSTAGAIPRRRR